MNKQVNLSVPRETTVHVGSLAEVWVIRCEKSWYLVIELSFHSEYARNVLVNDKLLPVYSNYADSRFTREERGTGKVSNSVLK